jgi:hypothetical protein
MTIHAKDCSLQYLNSAVADFIYLNQVPYILFSKLEVNYDTNSNVYKIKASIHTDTLQTSSTFVAWRHQFDLDINGHTKLNRIDFRFNIIFLLLNLFNPQVVNRAIFDLYDTTDISTLKLRFQDGLLTVRFLGVNVKHIRCGDMYRVRTTVGHDTANVMITSTGRADLLFDQVHSFQLDIDPVAISTVQTMFKPF